MAKKKAKKRFKPDKRVAEGRQELRQPQTYSKYQKLAEHLCNRWYPGTAKKPDIHLICEWTVNRVAMAFVRACDILRISRYNQVRRTEGHFSHDKGNPEDDYIALFTGGVADDAKHSVMKLWLCIALLEEHVKFLTGYCISEGWDKAEHYSIRQAFDNFYGRTRWPVNSGITVFNCTGWSALEAMFCFAHSIRETCSRTRTEGFNETYEAENYFNRLKNEIIVSPAMDECAKRWAKGISEQLQREYPKKQWPDNIIKKETNSIFSRLEFDCQVVRGKTIPATIETDWDVCQNGLIPIAHALSEFRIKYALQSKEWYDSEDDASVESSERTQNWLEANIPPVCVSVNRRLEQTKSWLEDNISPVCAGEFSERIGTLLKKYEIWDEKRLFVNRHQKKCWPAPEPEQDIDDLNLRATDETVKFITGLVTTIKPKLKLLRPDKTEQGAELKNPVSCVDVMKVVYKRSDSIARKLQSHLYPVIKRGNKYYCESEHVAILFPKWKKHLKEQQENE